MRILYFVLCGAAYNAFVLLLKMDVGIQQHKAMLEEIHLLR